MERAEKQPIHLHTTLGGISWDYIKNWIYGPL